LEEAARDNEGQRGPIGKPEARETILAEIVEPIAAHFDTLFAQRFFSLGYDWRVYRIQQMRPGHHRDPFYYCR
jgi:hypothetical protein